MSDMQGGFINIGNFPEGAIYRRTPMVGKCKSDGSKKGSWPEDLDAQIMSQPLDSLRLRTISYLIGKWFGCIGFIMNDGVESPKYGEKYQYRSVYNMREN